MDGSHKYIKEQTADEVRLNKYLSDAGFCSRREADRLIASGKVLVDGLTAVQGQKVLRGQQVTVGGRKIEPEQEMILLAVNKPRGVVCTTDRRWGDRTIYDVVDYPKRVFSVGRLDKDSEGLLLMTNYGDILNKIMRAGNYHEKEYLVTVDKDITPDFLNRMAAGVYLKELDVTTRPCRVEFAGKCQFRLVLTQGLNRQIRRMCEALHYHVKRLVRVRIMNIELGSLKPGEYRALTRKEFAQLQAQLRYSANPGRQEERPNRTGKQSDQAKGRTKNYAKGRAEDRTKNYARGRAEDRTKSYAKNRTGSQKASEQIRAQERNHKNS